jgi:TatD DNase family protein
MRTRALAAASLVSHQTIMPSFVDIGANLLDERFTHGIYRGSFRHEPDLDCIIERASTVGVKHIILTAGTVEESRQAVLKAREWNEQYSNIHFSCTVGVHPTRCSQVFEEGQQDSTALLQELQEIALDGMKDKTVVAIGEIGLDYDRLEFCSKEVQQKYLKLMLEQLAAPTQLPLFLHNRSVGKDLYDILQEHQSCWKAGVVHSYDDTLELATDFIKLGLFIGLNGCSLKTEENLAVVRDLPLDSILLETDCPYCDVRKTHAGSDYIKTQFDSKAEKKFQLGSLVKGRNEPCQIIQVAEVVAGAKDLDLDQVATTVFENSLKLYGL